MKTESQLIEIETVKPKIVVYTDISYSQPYDPYFGITNLKLDILKPEIENKKLPLVIYIPGGGFMRSPKANYIQQKVTIAESGFVVASVEYRVLPIGKFPDSLIDIKSAIRYLKAHAEQFNIDKNKVIVMGESAGGYLAAITGTTNGSIDFDKGDYLNENSLINGVVDLYGISDLTKIAADFSSIIQKTHNSPSSPEAIFLNGVSVFKEGGSVNADFEKAKKANPITYISSKTPPFLLMHGTVDMLVSPSQSDLLYQSLIENNIQAERYLIKGAGHGDFHWCQPKVINIIINFLNKILK